MKRVSVIGKTDAVINLNKIGVPVRGRSVAVLNIQTEEQEKELMGVIRMGLVDFVKSPDPILPTPLPPSLEKKDKVKLPKKTGRPKGSKNKPRNILAEEEGKRIAVAEAETQKMGSRVVIGTLDGPKTGQMRHSAVEAVLDSEKTLESLKAMEKLQKEEEEDINLPDTKIDESKLDASEQMGRKAVVSTQAGTDAIDLVNSILPESKTSKDIDPFIDRSDKVEQKKAEEAIKKAKTRIEEDDSPDDSFIEI